MKNMRKPKPRTVPTTLRELVRDLDDRLEDGDALSDVWLPHDEWARLVEEADAEVLEVGAAQGALVRETNSPKRGPDAGELSEERRIDLAEALDVGEDTDWADLVEVARGYAMALDAERERAVQRLAEPSASGEEQEPEHPECPHCGEADGHAPKDCANKGWERPTDAELAADSLRRLNGSAWKRQAKAAREANSLERCHHCGAGDQIAVELEYSKGDDVLPNAMLCAGCRARLRHTPEEWERRHGPTMVQSLERAEAEAAKKPRGKRKSGQVTLDEATTATKKSAPGRATKKFPLGGSDPTEKCTQCGAELGEHNGTKCPRAALQRGTVPIHDVEPSAEAPF